MTLHPASLLIGLLALPFAFVADGPETLEEQLKRLGADRLAKEARAKGDAKRGAAVFYRTELQCTRCHVPEKGNTRLGPDLTALDKDATDAHLIESILEPSKKLR